MIARPDCPGLHERRSSSRRSEAVIGSGAGKQASRTLDELFGKIVEVNARSPTTRGVPFGNAGSSGLPASITL
ncbi:hypothetical protein OH799_16555 [Nocardia sp. NBC_00881]|uniref:hypothetical protein n=1 Tax=Nocardia sp. NBC_00881 TaxID=2975995 RepID=UPI0038631DA9|nr:hypothetical protein OH799_16555 [Nocardia sp. NBC_00881]